MHKVSAEDLESWRSMGVTRVFIRELESRLALLRAEEHFNALDGSEARVRTLAGKVEGYRQVLDLINTKGSENE